MRQEFRESMKDTMAGSQVPEPEPLEGDSTEPSSVSPPWVIKLHHQHLADYVRVFMEEEEEMTMGEDWAAPLVTEALQTVSLASHIRCMADLLHVDAIQLLEVALLGTLVVQVIDLFAVAVPVPTLSKGLYVNFPGASSIFCSGGWNFYHQSRACSCINIWW